MPPRWTRGDRFGRYRIEGFLGRGGMGDVYLAYDEQLRRKIALKILHLGDDPRDADASSRLLREARAAAAIEHPNAVQVFDVDELDGVPFIAMELVEGKPLRAYIRDASVPLATKITWLAAIARALHAAHVRGVVHRDVKPENVLVRNDGVIKVLDFGTARRAIAPAPPPPSSISPMAETTAPNAAADPAALAATDHALEGTLLYMSPEHVRGEPLDGATDQWAWGVLAYELLTGAPPWDTSRGGVAILSQIFSSEPAPLATADGAEIPGALARVVLRALQKNRDARFATMAAVADALESPAITEPPPSPPKPLARAGIVMTAIFGVALVAFAVRGRHEAPSPPAIALDASPAPKVTVGPPDYGSPMSTNPTALAEYRRAVQAARDAASTNVVSDALDRARAADPEFAAAYLRELLQMEGLEDAWRTIFADAQRRRDQLGPHDRLLLDAIEPWFRVPPNRAELRQRFAKLAERDDADFDLQRCFFLLQTGDLDEARGACRDAQRLDPALAAAYLGEGLTYRGVDTRAEERAYNDCLQRSPEGARCMRALAEALAKEGRCDEYATLTHQLTILGPNDVDARVLGTLGAYASESRAGIELSAFRTAFKGAVTGLAPDVRPFQEARFEAAAAVAEGRLDEAIAAYARQARIAVALADEGAVATAYIPQLELLIDVGRRADAIALARRWLAERAAWVPNPGEDTRIFPLGALYRLGALPRDRFIAERTRWLADEEARGAALGRAFRWVDAFARAVVTDDDAREALDALTTFGPLSKLGEHPYIDGGVGVVELRAGHAAAASRALLSAATPCPDIVDPFRQLQIEEQLGEALASTGETAAACARFDRVLVHLDRARAATTARRARAAQSRLACR